MRKKRTALKDFCDQHSQDVAASILGVTQGAIHQMIKNKREVYIVKLKDGSLGGQEIKYFPLATRDGGPIAS